MLGTVGKASRLLDLFTSESPEWGVTEAALALGVPRSSAYDLLDTLACTGLLRRVDGNRYRLGLRLLALSNTALESFPVREHARPVMEALARKLGVAVHLTMLQGDEVLYLDTVAAGPSISLPGVGRNQPLHCTAAGKVLLAHQPNSSVGLTLNRLVLEPLTDHSVCSVDALRGELVHARRTGVARDREGSVDGVCCHAAPIIERGSAMAALSVSVPLIAERQHAERYDEIVRAAARSISRRLATAYAQRTAGERVAV